ncbi:hypothetical protein NKG94_42350 [Micromonospora sp. M12]
MLTAPEVDLTANRVVDLNAAQARQVRVATPQPTTVANSRIDVYRSFTSPEPTPTDWSALRETFWPSAAYDSLWALPTREKVKKGSFVFTTRIRAEQTPLAISYQGRRLSDPWCSPAPHRYPTAPRTRPPSSREAARGPTTPACPPAGRPWSFAAATR